MTYVDARLNKKKNIIDVVERIDGKRINKTYTPNYLFYYPDLKGKYTSIYGERLAKYETPSAEIFKKEKQKHRHRKLYESDANVTFRCLSDNYMDAPLPKLNVAFFDIETDFDKNTGFAEPDDPFNSIIAVAVHLAWLDQTVCLALKPSSLSDDQAAKIVSEFDNVVLMKDEMELIDTFILLIEDADILSGWNSEGYDIPYMVNRIAKLQNFAYTSKLCLWDVRPKKRTFLMYGKEQETYDLTGRIHMDYLQLYRKYTYHEMHSYSLDAISDYEVNEKKVVYEGTLDQLYHQDFKKFLEYNIQDTDLLRKIDNKLQFIDLANAIAHANGVLLPTTMGSVNQIDQAVINEAHSRNLIVPDKRRLDDNREAAGAFVVQPVKGLHYWIGSIDINSLYPSIIRALNMSPETIVGQIDQIYTAEIHSKIKKGPLWDGMFSCEEYRLVMEKNKTVIFPVKFEGQKQAEEMTGAELYDRIYLEGNNWILSANGTIFHNHSKGIIPGLLERWYSERQELQKKAEKYEGVDNEKFAYWDRIQHVRKILLNSAYGALLNKHSRFFDFRLGQSVTLTGRCINRHMTSTVNEILDNDYNNTGRSIIAGDTDSVYFSAYPLFKEKIESGEYIWTKEKVIELYDGVADIVNETFTDYMKSNHNCPKELGGIIRSVREIVGSTGLFIKKKKYGLMIIDNKGFRLDTDGKPGKLKAVGLDLKRSDTPDYMQDFLKDLLAQILTDCNEEIIIEKIKKFRTSFRDFKPWEKGTPKRVNKLTYYTNQWERTHKCGVGHILAGIHYNRLREMNNDQYSLPVSDGMKTILCKLKSHPMGITSVAIPIDENRIPEWFKALPFDEEKMEEVIIDNKINNLVGVLDLDLRAAQMRTNIDSLFDFS